MRLILLLMPAVLLAGQARFARLGESGGKVEVRLTSADAWMDAVRNLPLPEGALVRTAAGSYAELEFDDGGVLRLGAESLAEISDCATLSTGQRVTLLALDRGVAYFTGQPQARDATILNLPGSQAIMRQGARVRLEAGETWGQFAVLEGTIRFSSPAAELDVGERRMVRAEPANPARFFLYDEIAPLESDRWSEARDKALAAPRSASHIRMRYGMADLDTAGTWVTTERYGDVWLPKTASGWVPYRNGRWQWYDALGYTWVSGEDWGWLPFHYGRWTRMENGWAWVPGEDAAFHPGAVYWMRGAAFAAWGPLEPGEQYDAATVPRQFLNVHTTFAAYQADARVIDPAGFTARPKDALETAAFVPALPSPAFPAARLEARRPMLRAGRPRVLPLLAGTSYDAAAAEVPAPPAAPESAPQVMAQQEIPPAAAAPSPTPAPAVLVAPPRPAEVYYAAPVYTGIVVMNPPEREKPKHAAAGKAESKPSKTPAAATSNAKPQTSEAKPKVSAPPDQRRTRPAEEPKAIRTEEPKGAAEKRAP